MSVLTLDGQEYDVQVTGISRSAEIRDGQNADTLLSGRYSRDIIGTYYNYDVTFGTSKLSPADYDALYEVLTAPQDYHTLTIPYGQATKTFEVYITNVRHKAALEETEKSLQMVEQSIEDQMPEDFYSIDLMNAYEQLGLIIGEAVEDDLVNEIFSKFCMGK